jgi:hypothetical protein
MVEPHEHSPWRLHARPDGGDIPPTRMLLLHHAAHGRRPWPNGGVEGKKLFYYTRRHDAEQGNVVHL